MNPFLVKLKNFFGIIWPYATTIAISASNFLRYSNSSILSFIEIGVLHSILSVSEIPWIGDLFILCPL